MADAVPPPESGLSRLLPGQGWLQLLAGQEIRIASGITPDAPVVSTSFDLTGNVIVAVCRPIWAGLAPAERTALILRHGAAVDRAMAALATPEAAVERIVRGVRIAMWAAVAGPAGLWSLAEQNVTALLLSFATALALDATKSIHRGIAIAGRWYFRRLARRWLARAG